MVRGDFLELGNAFATELVAFKAPVGKAAFIRQVDGAGDLAFQGDALPLVGKVGHGDGGKQGPGIGMDGVVEQFFRRGLFHDGAQVHDGDLVGEVVHHGEVMGDEDIGEVHLLLEGFQQVEDLGLDGYVQGGDRLVTYHEIRVQRKCTGDADPLAAPVI